MYINFVIIFELYLCNKKMGYNKSANVPVENDKNIPLGLLGHQYHGKRRYTKSYDIEELAIEKYKQTGKGITFADLLTKD